MNVPTEDHSSYDQRVAHDIEKFGCHILSVFDPDRQELNFSYSIGIQKTLNAPEAIVIGVKPKLGHAMVSHYHHMVREGAVFEPSIPMLGFLEGFPIYVEPVTSPDMCHLTLGCEKYYGPGQYKVVQLVYPTVEGVWPWEEQASEWFRKNQPMLGRAHIV
jgi:hypothetical protein